jgi:hypothetical protein
MGWREYYGKDIFFIIVIHINIERQPLTLQVGFVGLI